MIAWAIDLLVAGLLVATIAFCFLLNRRLDAMRAAQADMAKLIADFDRATVRAKTGLAELKQASEEAGAALQQQIEQSKRSADELSFFIERGDRLATQLSQGGGARPAPPRVDPAVAQAASGAVAGVERELLSVLRRVK